MLVLTDKVLLRNSAAQLKRFNLCPGLHKEDETLAKVLLKFPQLPKLAISKSAQIVG